VSGFVIVDMRVRKLLKRFLATPMLKSDFLFAVMCSRLFFTLTDILILLILAISSLASARAATTWSWRFTVLFGGAMFAASGSSSAPASKPSIRFGIMNFVMLPMWILSGVFSPPSAFPDWLQPVINALPLTALNQALRGVMLEGSRCLPSGHKPESWPRTAC